MDIFSSNYIHYTKFPYESKAFQKNKMNDRGEEKLEQEQVEILMKFLQMMPDSSQETILTQDDQELTAKNEQIFFGRSICCRKEEQGVLTEGEEISYSSQDAVKKYRGNITKSRPKSRNFLKNELGEEENDSGFATPSEQLLKVATPENISGNPKLEDVCEQQTDSDLLYSDSEDSCKTMESVSLLREPAFLDQGGNNENDESCMNTALNEKSFPSILCHEEMQVDQDWVHSVDKSVQTISFLSLSEDYVHESTDFLRSFVNMKNIVLPKKNASGKKYMDLLKNADQAKGPRSDESADEMDNEEWGFEFDEFGDFGSSVKFEKNREAIVPREAVNYVAAATNTEDMVMKSVESILVWMKNEIKKNCRHFCNYWHGSTRANAVQMINEVVDLHSGLVRIRVSQFLVEIFDEIYELDFPVEDILLENKIAFLSCFCKSFLLSYDLIEHVSRKLSRFTKPRLNSKFQMMTLIKKSYFSLRLLNDLLRSFLAHLQTEGFQSIFRRGSSEEELNVLNLWKRDRKRSENSGETHGSEMIIKNIKAMAQWCRRTDQVLSFCLNEVPLLSKPAHICFVLAQDIIFFQNAMLKRG